MGIQEDVRDAVDEGRDDLIGALAEHHVFPTVVDQPESSIGDMIGASDSPTVRLDADDGTADVLDRQTTARVVDTLGLDSEEACETTREEIESHSSWG